MSEGTHTISARIASFYGYFAEVEGSFTIDTIAPVITISSPQDNFLTNLSSLTISGALNEEAVLTMNNEAVILDALSFSKSVVLSEGANEFTFSATDPAGNSSSAVLHITLDTSGGGGELPPDPSEVATPIDPTVPTDIYATTAFLYSGEDPIQKDVAPGTIEARRVAILRGKVLGFDGQHVKGVKVTILNHPEFGWTLTREDDGMFDMAVNGGGQLVISYAKDGFAPVQRHLDTPWRDFMWADDVVMTRLDSNSTTINLSTPLPMQVAQGSEITDVDGTRKAAILFPAGTTAQMVMSDGTTQPLTTANVRVTEYTVGEDGPKAMPAELPPQSAYTYCVELSADEAIANNASSVQFSQPLIYYVDNFIGFPVGSPVPVGSYDRTKGQWIPKDNGLVIKILGFDSGLAILDVDGTGLPADPAKLATLGITDEERARIALLYPVVGTGLWRWKLYHFSPSDANYPMLTEDAIAPPGDTEKQETSDDDCPEEGASVIGIQSQVLSEAFSLIGLSNRLSYQSKRVKDYSTLYSLKIPISKSYLPLSLKSMELEVEVAGQIHKFTYSPEENLVQSFSWDGKDAYGRTYKGSVPANIAITYVYGVRYAYPATVSSKSFSQFSTSGIAIGGSRDVSEVTLTRKYSKMVENFDAGFSNIGGWALSGVNAYDPTGQKVHSGTGEVRSAANMLNPINTIAGNGTYGFSGDGGPARNAQLNYPAGICTGPDGSLYIADWNNHRVRKVDPSGIITTKAVVSAFDVCLGPDGSLYIVYDEDNRIRKIDPSGIITTVAGGSTCGFEGDGVLATEATLRLPTDVSLGHDGCIYIADWGNKRIRKVDSLGIITTYGGTGQSGYGGDGGSPTQALIDPEGNISIGPDGSLYFAEFNNGRIRKISSAIPGFSVGDISVPSSTGSELYRFSSQGRHLQTLNALTGSIIWSFGYDAEGRLVSITDAYSNTATIQRDSNGNPTAIVSPYGQTTTLTTDANGYLSSIHSPGGSTMTFTYSEGGLLETFTDSKGQVHAFTYDDKGRLINDADPSGGAKSLQMTEVAGGWSVTVTSAEGTAKTYTISDTATGGERREVAGSGCTSCSSVSEILPNGTTTVTSGDGTISQIVQGPDPRLGVMASIPKSFSVAMPGGKTLSGTMTRTVVLSNPADLMSLTSQTDTLTINSKTFTTTYTASNKTFLTKTPLNRQVTSQIDANGKVLSQSISGIDSVSFSYDSKGRTSSLSQGSRTVGLSYDPQGNLSCVTDPLSRTVNFAYDPNGRVTSQTFPDGRSAGFTYDANGNVTSVTPPGKTAHTFTYTTVDLQATYTPPDIGIGPTTTTYSYNLDRQLTGVDRPDGKSISMAYDGSGRLSSVTTPEGTTSLAYDGVAGQLASIQNPEGITNSYTYDGFLPLKETWSGNVSGSIARTFNNDFQLSGVSLNGGAAIPYTYDSDGLLTAVDGLTLVRNTSNGLLTGSTLGNVTDTYTYNSFGEVSNYTAAYPAGLSCQISYTRDAVGRITTKTEAINGITTTWGYTYDLAGRLTQTTENGDLWASYGYDTNGNRLTKTTSSQTISGTYDAQDRLTVYVNYTYSYTANGELETKTNTANGEVTSYSYDVLGNLKSVVLPDATVIEYVVDGRNRRVGKKVGGTLQKQWLYDGQLRPVAELGPTGTVTATFVYATHINVPDYIIKGATTYRVITDHLGSLRFVIDTATGTIAQRVDYDDWGNVLVNTAPDFTPFGFAGGIYDSQTKLVRFGARDYDAETGGWTAKDLIIFGGLNVNLYSYVFSDPLNHVDPFGFKTRPKSLSECEGLPCCEACLCELDWAVGQWESIHWGFINLEAIEWGAGVGATGGVTVFLFSEGIG